MKYRHTVIGLLVAALVAGGVYWARSQFSHTGSAPVGELSADDRLPDLSLRDGVADLGDVRIVVSLLPHPPVAFAKFQFRVTALGPAPSDASAAGAGTRWPLAIKDGQVGFEMTMPMGDHRYALVPAGRGGYAAEVVLPLCASGSRRWYARVEGTAAGRPVSARFRLDLAKPGSPQAP